MSSNGRLLLTVVLCLSFGSLVSGQTIKAAQALEAQENWHGAELVWRKLAAQSPRDFRLWTSLGVALAHQNEYEQAITEYRKSLRLSAHDPQTNWNLGLAFFKTGKLPEALKPLQTAAEAMPGNPQIETVLAMSLYGAGRYGEAVPYLEKMNSRSPGNSQLEQTLAESYLYSGNYDRAAGQLQSMLKANPDSPEIHMFLGEAEDGAGHLEKAVAEFQQATRGRPVPNAHFGLGYLLWKDHRYDEAAAEFRSELAADPNHSQALGYLGDILVKQGSPVEAEKVLRHSIASRDSLWLTHFQLGVLESDRKDYASAVGEMKRALAFNSNRSEPHYRLAQIYKAMGNPSAANDELRKLTALHQHEEEKLVQQISGPQ